MNFTAATGPVYWGFLIYSNELNQFSSLIIVSMSVCANCQQVEKPLKETKKHPTDRVRNNIILILDLFLLKIGEQN